MLSTIAAYTAIYRAKTAGLGVERFPRDYIESLLPVVGKQRSLLQKPQLDESVVPVLPNSVPPDAVATGVFVDIRLLRMKWSMDREVGDVEEKGRSGIVGSVLTNHPNGTIGEIIGEVVTVGVHVHVDDRVAFDELVWVVQIRHCPHHSVELIKPTLERPRTSG